MSLLSVIDIGFKLIDKILPDEEAKIKAKTELLKVQKDGDLEQLESSMKVIIAEAKGGSWLQRNWRPITMLTSLGLIVARWFGLTPNHIPLEVELYILGFIKIGLGGYIVGRTGEKMMKTWKGKD